MLSNGGKCTPGWTWIYPSLTHTPRLGVSHQLIPSVKNSIKIRSWRSLCRPGLVDFPFFAGSSKLKPGDTEAHRETQMRSLEPPVIYGSGPSSFMPQLSADAICSCRCSAVACSVDVWDRASRCQEQRSSFLYHPPGRICKSNRYGWRQKHTIFEP